jgi:hypothetical protein
VEVPIKLNDPTRLTALTGEAITKVMTEVRLNIANFPM